MHFGTVYCDILGIGLTAFVAQLASMTIVDSHMHVWRAAVGDTPSVASIVPPQSDVSIECAVRTLDEVTVDRAVLVQPVFRGEDNSYVVQCAQSYPGRFAAVCVVVPREPHGDKRLEHWASAGCRGLRMRPRLAVESASFGAPNTFSLWQAAERLGIVVSLLSSPEHNQTIDAMAERFAGARIVVDHLGHPVTGSGRNESQIRRLLSLSRHPQVYIKLSGFHHFSSEPFPYRDTWETARAALDCFGPDRLLWGSDFPHVVPCCGYARSLALLDEIFPQWGAGQRAAVLGENALKLYWPSAASKDSVARRQI